MINDEFSYWGINKLKNMIHKLPNISLILEWRNIRVHNDSCPFFDYSKCNFCISREECYNSLAIEEVITEELIDRGLLDYVLNIGSKLLNDSKFNDTLNTENEIDWNISN